MESMKDTLELNNGVVIPRLGFGVFRIVDEKEGEKAIAAALEAGYRLFDTASVYGNEEIVGRALGRSGVPRKELFITTKAWNSELGYEETKEAFERSRERLATDYIDLYLIHWPLFDQAAGAWSAMEELHGRGLIRAIGVSNFNLSHLDLLAEQAKTVPAVNQVEFHPYLVQHDLLRECSMRGIRLEAWSPFIRGKVFSDPLIAALAEKHGKSVAQIVLRWILQKDIITIPKSAAPERIRENSRVFDFSLSDAETKQIDALHRGEHLGPTPENFREYFRNIGK